MSSRLKVMKMKFKPLTTLVLAMTLAAGACGGADDANTVAGADADSSQLPTNEQGDTDLPVADQPNTDETSSQEPTIEPGGNSNDDDPADSPQPLPNPSGLQVIGSANIGGEIVSPQFHEITELLIAESYPEQLQISFVAGDENCLAATATAQVSEDGSQVIVLLQTGITTDALSKSCLAGEFEHHLSIPLEVGLDGRDVVTPGQPEDEPEPTAPPAEQPFEETLIGMSEEAGTEGAESFGYTVRVLERDGELFAATMDYRTNRINLTITDGVITDATIG